MAEPARTTGSGLSHPPTIPGAAEEALARSGRKRTRRGGGAYAPCRCRGLHRHYAHAVLRWAGGLPGVA
eukprot:6198861-Pleurochrysis_carterae.AAC.1